MEDKKTIRKEILKIRDSLSIDEREKYNKDIFNKVIINSYYKKAKCIFIFVSYKTEVDTHKIIKKAIDDGKIVCIPKVVSKSEGMYAAQIEKFNDLEPGKYGILEPKKHCKKINEEQIDLILTPGAVFDNKGGRIGYGGGFYDRFLVKTKKSAPKIALAYNVQIINKVPMDELDVRIDGIISNG
ncbi:5-formyltetrahydrofolate cyclo-ligase [Clostridium tetanomorphum]|uniref:5-formyltetrahydrofolate cyclo-ligase n=2 Tax=Clostridium tetanomorphum TaxID=1553 RepID=UPI00044D8D9A|nr:5-formyltetrahydrofolate cyclo-ligase [Clostridium tetanomorphum]KAJ52765.1 5-formyltetrahydrofolate cyclo-ligase [Clostridium tetanomorphum DSM 665]MBP1865348.1 5-formyltetrahydrofolate cyclo-ligase [Clostridium tetanomorphum]NRS84885.1 5-formyltetrahydrofolate cyclo-ligase [Clostridium tetanomorphum]